MTDREQMQVEMEHEDGEWRRLNVRQDSDGFGVLEFCYLIAGLGVSVAFWEGLAWVLKVFRHV